MKINKKKMELAMARACMNVSNISDKSGVSRKTVAGAKDGRKIDPAKCGRIAKALGVDPEEIIEKDDE